MCRWCFSWCPVGVEATEFNGGIYTRIVKPGSFYVESETRSGLACLASQMYDQSRNTRVDSLDEL